VGWGIGLGAVACVGCVVVMGAQTEAGLADCLGCTARRGACAGAPVLLAAAARRYCTFSPRSPPQELSSSSPRLGGSSLSSGHCPAANLLSLTSSAPGATCIAACRQPACDGECRGRCSDGSLSFRNHTAVLVGQRMAWHSTSYPQYDLTLLIELTSVDYSLPPHLRSTFSACACTTRLPSPAVQGAQLV
jgi:hypothetical protein